MLSFKTAVNGASYSSTSNTNSLSVSSVFFSKLAGLSIFSFVGSIPASSSESLKASINSLLKELFEGTSLNVEKSKWITLYVLSFHKGSISKPLNLSVPCAKSSWKVLIRVDLPKRLGREMKYGPFSSFAIWQIKAVLSTYTLLLSIRSLKLHEFGSSFVNFMSSS